MWSRSVEQLRGKLWVVEDESIVVPGFFLEKLTIFRTNSRVGVPPLLAFRDEGVALSVRKKAVNREDAGSEFRDLQGNVHGNS